MVSLELSEEHVSIVCFL